MKALMITLACSFGILASCAKPSAPSAAAPGVAGPADSPYRTWTTAQLQQRRNDLYYMLPQRRTQGGPPLPQQEEIRAIEAELIRRFRAGDKAAELKPVWPGGTPPQG